MTLISAATLLLMFAIGRWGHLPALAPLRRWLVERPAAALNRFDRRWIIFAVLFVILIVAGGELLAIMGPLDMSVVLLWDVASLVDALAAAVLVAGSTRVKPLVEWVTRRLRGTPRPRACRARSQRSIRPANDDDDPALVLALVA